MSAGFPYMGWILGLHCFRLTNLDVYQWPKGFGLSMLKDIIIYLQVKLYEMFILFKLFVVLNCHIKIISGCRISTPDLLI